MDQSYQPLELKSLADDGTFEGLAADGNIETQGDRIEPGAFKAAEGQQIPLLFAHKTDKPVGIGTVTETPHGLWVKGKLLLDTIAGRKAYTRPSRRGW
jgi:HK97 family phage prohead protease